MSRRDRRAGGRHGDSGELFAEATAHYRNGAFVPGAKPLPHNPRA